MLQPIPNDAVALVAGVGLSTLLLLALVDFGLTFTERPTVGEWITRWAGRYPMFALALTLVAGGLLGHFYFATP